MAEHIADIGLDEVAALKAKVQAGRKGGTGIAERRAAETSGQKANDGRVRSAAADTKGNVQLNVRVTPDVKNRVIALARATGSDMSSVVEDALLAYFKRKDA